MKKMTLLLALLLAGGNVLAEEQDNVMSNLTIAAADTGAALSWSVEKSEPAQNLRLEKKLEEKAQLLNDKLNAQLEKSLEEKLNRELMF